MRELVAAFYYDEHYGFGHIPGHGSEEGDRSEMTERFARVLCSAAAGEGEASPEEIKWIQGYLATKGYPEKVIEKVPEMCKLSESKTIEQIGVESKQLLDYPGVHNAAPALIYGALRAAGADGLHSGEEKTTRMIAGYLDVSEEHVDKIKELIEKEKALKKERISLLWPNGFSALRPEFQPK